MNLPENRRHKVIWRLDSGFGGDKNINELLHRGYHLLVKGSSNRRAAKLATLVKRWQPVGKHKFVGWVPTPARFCRPVHTVSVRQETRKGIKLAYLLTTLSLPAAQVVHLYDQRGGAETEFRADKSGGIHLHKRRKHKRDAQEAWVLLTDMVHNYLSWFSHHILHDSPFQDFGPLRISRDLMRTPGWLDLHQGQLLSVQLLKTVPHSEALLTCLGRFYE